MSRKNVYELKLITFKTAHCRTKFVGVLSRLVSTTTLLFNCTFSVAYCL